MEAAVAFWTAALSRAPPNKVLYILSMDIIKLRLDQTLFIVVGLSSNVAKPPAESAAMDAFLQVFNL